jgi:hypothetical protein
MLKIFTNLSPVKVYVRNDYIYRKNLEPLINTINSLNIKPNKAPGWIHIPTLSSNNYVHLVSSREPIVINNIYRARFIWSTLLSCAYLDTCPESISAVLVVAVPLYYASMIGAYDTRSKALTDFEQSLHALNKCLGTKSFSHEYDITLLD